MKRVAFKMFLKPGFEEEYQKRHSAIWPELKQLLKETGVTIIPYFGIKKPIYCLQHRRLMATNRLKR